MSSQYEEDQIIADFFGDYVGTFLDLGAGDGQLCSNTEELVNRGWGGVCVEPHAESFSSLRNLYKLHPRVKLVHAAVSDNGRPIKFYHHYEQLSTGVSILATSDEWYWISSITQPCLCSIVGDWFDFVSIDCEGMDQEIISGAFLKHTQLLCYEHDLPRLSKNKQHDANWNDILITLGFTKVVGKTKGNTLVARQ